MSNANEPAADENGRAEAGSAAKSPGSIQGLAQFCKETWAELHRVQWPNQQTVTKHTVVVVSLIIFMALYIGALDVSVSWLFGRLIKVG